MNNLTETKFKNWMTAHPDSDHPNDKERFMEFIREADKNNDLVELLTMDLYQVVKTYHPQWIKEYVYEFVNMWRTKINHEVNKRLERRHK
jgi:hypothetical protein